MGDALFFLLPKGRRKEEGALFSSYCIAIDVIRTRQINAVQTIPDDRPQAPFGRIFDVA
jgi:hypothetical protein